MRVKKLDKNLDKITGNFGKHALKKHNIRQFQHKSALKLHKDTPHWDVPADYQTNTISLNLQKPAKIRVQNKYFFLIL